MKDSKKLLAYCGLYCGDCAGYLGEISDAAIKLENKLNQYKFEKTAKNLFTEKLKEYDKFHEMLQFITELKCEKICREKEDTEHSCKVRKCCRSKRYFACYECEIYENCETLRITNKQELYGDSYLKNFEGIKEMGLDNWMKKGKRYWFADD
ncbi:MAG: DUF3795 domain-containing protein [Promethearchaeota archaeon]